MRFLWTVLVLSLILVALWRISSQIFDWLRRKLGEMEDAEVEPLSGAFREDVLNLLRRLFLAVTKWPFRRRKRSARLPSQVESARRIYRQLLAWAATRGHARTWASVGEYRYHQAQTAYTNLRSNALLVFDGSLGHVTEVLSGTNYEPLSTSSPHQIWSAAMVVSPLLRGMFGLQRDVPKQTLTFAPHTPADWGWYTLKNVGIGTARVALRSRKTVGELILEVDQNGGEPFKLNYEPAISPRAKVLGVELNGKPAEYHVTAGELDQHVVIHTTITGKVNTIRIRMKNDFGITYHLTLPALGEQSQGLRMLTETWSASRDALTLEFSGTPGASYELPVWNAKLVASVDGAKLVDTTKQGTVARIQLPGAKTESSAHSKVVFHF